jgi:SAM-dependent methyltransferase
MRSETQIAIGAALRKTTPGKLLAAREHFDRFLRRAAPLFTANTQDRTTELVYRSHHQSFNVEYGKQYVIQLLRLLRYLLDASIAEGEAAAAFGSLRIERYGVPDTRQLDGGTRARYHVANLCDLGRFRDAHFDSVISHCCLQDVSNYRLALQEIARVVRTEGRMILSVVHAWTWQFDAHWGPPWGSVPRLH